MDPDGAPVARDHPVVEAEGLPGPGRSLVLGDHPLSVLGMEPFLPEPGVGDPLLGSKAQHGLDLGADVELRVPLLVVRVDALLDVRDRRYPLDERPELRLGLPEFPLDALALAHVDSGSDRPDDLPAGTSKRLDMALPHMLAPRELVPDRLACQGAAMRRNRLELRVVGPEELEEGEPDRLVGPKTEGGETGAAREGESKLRVRRPEHAGNAIDQIGHPRLAWRRGCFAGVAWFGHGSCRSVRERLSNKLPRPGTPGRQAVRATGAGRLGGRRA